MTSSGLRRVCACFVISLSVAQCCSDDAEPAEFVPGLEKGMSWEIAAFRLENTSGVISGPVKISTIEYHLQYKVDDYVARDGTSFIRISVYLDDPSQVPRPKAGRAVAWYIMDRKTHRVRMVAYDSMGIPENGDPVDVDGEKPVYMGSSMPLEIPVWPSMTKDAWGRWSVPETGQQIVYPDPDLRERKVTQFSFIVDLPGPVRQVRCLNLSLVSNAGAEKLERGYRTQLWVQGVPWWLQWRSVPLSAKLDQLGRTIYARLVRWQDAQGKVHEIPQGQLPLGIFP